MSVAVVFNGTSYLLPTAGETGWGSVVTNFLSDVGSNAATAASTQTFTNKLILAQSGTVTAPSHSFASDSDTGMYQPSVGLLYLATNGVDRLKIDGSGNITVTGSLTAASLAGSLTSPTITTPTVTGGTFTSPTLNTASLTSPTVTGSIALTTASSGIELGSVTSANTPFIDFHSSGTSHDYDSRILASGGTSTDGAGNLTYIAVNNTFGGSIVATAGNITANTGSINAGAGLSNTQAGLAQFMSADANLGYLSIGAGWAWRFDRVQGNMSWNNSAGTPLEGWNAGGHWFCGDPFFAISGNASQRIFAFANTWYWLWNSTTGDLSWNQGGVGLGFMFRVSDGLSYSARGPAGGNGAYSNISDANVKTDLREAEHGLTHVCALTPQRFRRTTSATTDREEVGFVAQDVQAVIPEAVHDIGTKETPLLAMQIDPIVAALVNAVKELAKEVAELKRK